MGCNCGKKKPVVIAPQPIPQTPDEQHTQDMNEYIKTLGDNTEEPKTEDNG